MRQGGQAWTTLAELAAHGHRVDIREVDPALTGVGITPTFGIGQRGLVVHSDRGGFLWDCVGFIDDAAVKAVRARGGIAGIAMSHPHFYGTMVEWSQAFGGCPIYIPEADAAWVQYDDPSIVKWNGIREVLPGLTLIQCGGHFEGSAVLHWRDGADGRGALLVGDSITVVPDVRFVSFMRSYPNHIPLPADAVRSIVAAVEPYRFDRIYGGWWDRIVATGGMAAIERSAVRYLKWIGAR